MNVSAACPQCGAIANPNDRFCNTCGNPLQRPGHREAPKLRRPSPPTRNLAPLRRSPYGGQPQYPPQGYPQQPPPQQYGAPGARPPRCQLGHDIMPGMSYCAQGHPIALDAMQFANDPNAAYAQQPQPAAAAAPPQQGYGAPGLRAPQAWPRRSTTPRRGPPPAQGLGFGAPQPYRRSSSASRLRGAAAAAGGTPQPQPGLPGRRRPPPQAAVRAAPRAGPSALPDGHLARSAAAGAVPAKQLRGFVVSFQSNPSGDFWPVSTGRTTVGRANAPEPADVPLADATISSRHAAFMIDLNVVMIEDTNSTNGTYVNEEHIGQNGKRELRDGDRVRFGGYTTIVKILGRL